MAKSNLEAALAFQIKALKLPAPEREYRFLKKRKHRFDFAWPDLMFAVECQGIVWSGKGGHQTGTGIEKDIEKFHLAMMNGWDIYLCSMSSIKKGWAIEYIEKRVKAVS